jgi:hypothetical protein
MTKAKLSQSIGEPSKRPAVEQRVCLSYAEFGKRVGLSAATIRRLAREGEIPVHIFNQRLARVPITALAFFS